VSSRVVSSGVAKVRACGERGVKKGGRRKRGNRVRKSLCKERKVYLGGVGKVIRLTASTARGKTHGGDRQKHDENGTRWGAFEMKPCPE